jgi:PAS domain S-box-containing protein
VAIQEKRNNACIGILQNLTYLGLMASSRPSLNPGPQSVDSVLTESLSFDTLAMIFNGHRDCVKLLDADGRIHWMNANGQALMEIDNFAQYLGRPWADFWPQSALAQIEAAFAAARQGATGRFESQCPTAAGTVLWWNVTVSPIYDQSPNLIGYLAISRDITADRAAVDELNRSKLFIEGLIETAPTVLYIYDLIEQRNIFVGPQIKDICGLDDAAVQEIGNDVMPTLMHPDDLHRVHAHHADIRAGKKSQPFEIQYRMKNEEGAWRWFSSTEVIHATDADGRITRILGAALDCTERHEHETVQALMLAELEHRIKNAFAAVQSVAALTLKNSCPPAVWDVFQKRIFAMADAQTLLTKAKWQGAPLSEIVRVALNPFSTHSADRLTVEGAEINIMPNEARSLSLILHELCTNAVKYGAWSNDDGKVAIFWKQHSDAIILEWREFGGPPVIKPETPGFGSVLIDSMAAVVGESATQYHAEGIHCTLRIIA